MRPQEQPHPRAQGFCGHRGQGQVVNRRVLCPQGTSGFKLHLTVDGRGETVSFCATPGNADGRNPAPKLARPVPGKLSGGRGHIPKALAKPPAAQGAHLGTPLKKNMKQAAMGALDKPLPRKRSIIGAINGQPKNIFGLEHSRHRSPTNYLPNLMACLTAYSCSGQKTSPGLTRRWFFALAPNP